MRCLVCICRMRVGVSAMRLMRMCRRRYRHWWVFISSSSRHTLRDWVGKEDGRLLKSSAFAWLGVVGRVMLIRIMCYGNVYVVMIDYMDIEALLALF